MRIDSIGGSVPLKAELLETVKNLEVGDVIKGRILEAAEGSVTIRTSGGQTLTAALLADVQLQKGAFAELLIKNIVSNKLLAELVNTDRAQPELESKLADILTKNNLPVNEKNIEAAKLLIKYNLPVNKDALMEVVNLQKSIASLGSGSSEGAVGLLLSGQELESMPVEVLNKIMLAAEPEVKALLSQGETEQPEAGVKAAPEGEPRVSPESENTAAGTQTKISGEVRQTQGDAAETVNAKNIAENLEKGIADVLKKLGIEPDSDTARLITNTAKLLSSAGKTDMESLVYLLSKNIEVTSGNLEALKRNINNEGKLSALLEKLDNKLETHEGRELKEIRDEIKKLSIAPGNVADKEEVKQQLKDTIRLGEKLESLLAKNNISDPEIRSTLMNLRDNIDFIRNINNYNNYIQIPLLVNEKNTTAEVYVFKDGKRSKAIDPQNATILIALDLQNLGHLESMINIAQKTVNVTFRVEDKRIGNLISSRINELKGALEAKGYYLNSIRVIKLEQSFNLISLEEMINDRDVEKMHFDMKV